MLALIYPCHGPQDRAMAYPSLAGLGKEVIANLEN